MNKTFIVKLLFLIFYLCMPRGVSEAKKIYDFIVTDENKPENFMGITNTSFKFVIDDVEWDINYTRAKGLYYAWDWSTTSGIHIGSNSYPASDATIFISNLTDTNITKIIVTAGRNKDSQVTLSVSVGDIPFLCEGVESVMVDVNKNNYVFEYEEGAKGDIIIYYTVDNNAVYFFGLQIYDDSPLINPELSYSTSFLGLDSDDISDEIQFPILSYSSDFTGSITYNSSNEDVAKVNREGTVTLMGTIGTAIITASVEDDGLYEASSASYVVLVKEPHTFDFEIHNYGMTALTTGEYEIAISNITGKDGISATLNGNYRLYENEGLCLQLCDGGSIIISALEGESIAMVDIQGVVNDSNLSALACEDGSFGVVNDNAKWMGEAQSVIFTSNGIVQILTIDVTLSGTKLGSGTLQIVANEGYATFYTNSAFVMPISVEGTTIIGVENDKLIMGWEYTEGTIVPAETALLLHGSPGTYNYDIVVSSATTPTNNLLHGSLVEVETSVNGSTDGYLFYMLSYDQSGNNIGFYWGKDDGAPFMSEASKAWLAIDKDPNVNVTRFILNDDYSNDIHSTTTENIYAPTTIYNLQGIRVDNISRIGIYLIGGKKRIYR